MAPSDPGASTMRIPACWGIRLSLPSTLLLLAWLMLGPSGCAKKPFEDYRYVDVELPPAQALEELDRVAADSGQGLLPITKGVRPELRVWTVPACLPGAADRCCKERLEKKKTSSNCSMVHDRQVYARAVSLPEGKTRLELGGSRPGDLAWSAAAGPSVGYRVWDFPPLDSWWTGDLDLLGGVERSAEGGWSWRIDPSLRFGPRLVRWGGEDELPGLRRSLILQLSPGMAIRPDEVAFRGELLLGLESHVQVRPLPDRTIALGPIRQLDLGLAWVAWSGQGRQELEASLAYHVWPFGGAFVRVGRELGGERTGTTVMVGLQLDALMAVVAPCGVLGAMSLQQMSLKDIIGSPCRHGDPCWDERESGD